MIRESCLGIPVRFASWVILVMVYSFGLGMGVCVVVVSRRRSFEERSHFGSHCWAQRTDLPVL